MVRSRQMANKPHPEGPLITLTAAQRGAIRTSRGVMEQKDLAAKVKVTPATISNIESGRYEQVRKGVYVRILKALKLPTMSAPDDTAAKLEETIDVLAELSPEHLETVRVLAANLRDRSRKPT